MGNGSLACRMPVKAIVMRALAEKVWHLGGENFSPFTFSIVP